MIYLIYFSIILSITLSSHVHFKIYIIASFITFYLSERVSQWKHEPTLCILGKAVAFVLLSICLNVHLAHVVS